MIRIKIELEEDSLMMSTPTRGYVSGKLTLEYSGVLNPESVMKFHPELKSMLNEIKDKGWKYLYIETKGKAVSEVNLEKKGYLIYGGQYPSQEFSINIEIGSKPLEIMDVPEVEEFRINISTKSFPRAATIDLCKGVVTYIHEPFWGWKPEWENDPKKVSEAKEVYEVAKWLVEDKKLTLHESYEMERYKSLAEILEKLSAAFHGSGNL